MPTALSSDEQALQSLLQAAIDVELFTIPLYMTAAYSLRFTTGSGETLLPANPAPRFGPQPLTPNQQAYNILFSVFIQEMLHLEMACNLSNALGFAPTLNPPDYTTGRIPHIKQPPANINVALGPLDQDRFELFKYIETPDFKGEDFPLTEPPEGFETIGALYKALRYWVTQLWEQRYDPNALQLTLFNHGLSKTTPPVYTYEKISGDGADALVQALRLIDEIVSQGEGADAAGDVPVAYQPDLTDEEKSQYPSTVNDAEVRAFWDKYSHYRRFDTDLAAVLERLTLWPGSPQDLPDYYYTDTPAEAQSGLNIAWIQLLGAMQSAFHSADKQFPFNAMQGFNGLIVLVWACGLTPQFQSETPPTPAEYHACQGLNACQSLGRGQTGSGPGDGDCATAVFHNCGASNACSGQGGCGWPVNPDTPDPGQNSCQGLGGCGAPIPAQQVMHTSAEKGMGVWDIARKLFEAQMESQGKTPLPAPPVNNLRQSLIPT